MPTIDDLSIVIQSSADSASTGLSSLVSTLERLQGVVQPAQTALQGLASTFRQFSANVSNSVDISPFVRTITGISQAISQIPADAADRIRALSGLMNSLKAMNASGGTGLASLQTAPQVINELVNSAQRITDADIQRMNAMAAALRELNAASANGGASLAQKAMESAAKSRSASMGGIFAGMKNGLASIAPIGKAAIGTVLKPLDQLKTSILGATKGILGFVSGLARIAGYRFLRTLIKEITSGAKEGLQNLAHASAEANAQLSRLSSASLTMKNSLGGALYSALYPIIGVLQTIANAAANALNWISQLFAILGGRATYMRATSAMKEWKDQTGGAAGAAKALKQELMGFDEINSLTPDGGGGGGGGGGGALDYGAMFEESPVSSWLKSMVDSGDFTEMGHAIANKINAALGSINWTEMRAKAEKVAGAFATFINGLFDPADNEGIDPEVMGQSVAGVINTAAGFVLKFWNKPNWLNIGTQVKEWLIKAMDQIDPVAVGGAISGKFRAAIQFMKGLVPNTRAEWEAVTSKAVEILKEAIIGTPVEDLGTVLGNLLNGAIIGIKNLANAETLYTIAQKITQGLRNAVGVISVDDLIDAMKYLAVDVGKAIYTLLDGVMNLEITINGIDFQVSDIVVNTLLLGAMLVRTLSPYFASMVQGVGPTGGLALIGGIYFTIDALIGLGKIISNTMNGGEWSWADFSDVIGSALEAAGFLLIFTGHPVAGAISIGLGVLIKLIPKIEWEDVPLITPPGISPSVAQIPGDSVEYVQNLQGVTSAANEAETATKSLTDQTEAYGKELQETFGADTKKQTSAITSNVESFCDTTSEATDELAAMGEEAQQVFDNIVMIPTEREIMLSIRNYNNLISNLNTIKSKIDEISRTKLKIQIQASLSPASKLFLQRLKEVDASMASRIDAIISASTMAAAGYARGGYPAAGQLYVANENGMGSELIGQIGSRHAVANSEQIGDAIFRYMDEHDRANANDEDMLAAAMARAIRATGLGAVYLDGRQLAQSINRETRRSGKPALNF